jgi:hypothetical protein
MKRLRERGRGEEKKRGGEEKKRGGEHPITTH